MRGNSADVISALRGASFALWKGFFWGVTPEGTSYWRAQANHLEALADQLEARSEDTDPHHSEEWYAAVDADDDYQRDFK